MNTGFKAIIENNLQLGHARMKGAALIEKIKSSDVASIGKGPPMNKQGDTYSDLKVNLELVNQNEMLEMRLHGMQIELEKARATILEKNRKIEKQEAEIISVKSTIVHLGDKITQLTEENQLYYIKLNKQNVNSNDTDTKAHVLEKQVHALTEALLSCEQSVETLLKEKSKMSKHLSVYTL